MDRASIKDLFCLKIWIWRGSRWMLKFSKPLRDRVLKSSRWILLCLTKIWGTPVMVETQLNNLYQTMTNTMWSYKAPIKILLKFHNNKIKLYLNKESKLKAKIVKTASIKQWRWNKYLNERWTSMKQTTVQEWESLKMKSAWLRIIKL